MVSCFQEMGRSGNVGDGERGHSVVAIQSIPALTIFWAVEMTLGNSHIALRNFSWMSQILGLVSRGDPVTAGDRSP